MKKNLDSWIILSSLLFLPTCFLGQTSVLNSDNQDVRSSEYSEDSKPYGSVERFSEDDKRRLFSDFTETLSEIENYEAIQNEEWNNRSVQNGNWEELGPFNNVITTTGWSPGNGRVTSMAEHPSDPNTILIGTYYSGVWKTNDGGDSWIPLSDNFANNDFGIQSVAIDPSNPNTYYFGSVYQGLYRSVDAGATWENLGYIIPQQPNTVDFIEKILVDPTNSNILYVALLDYEGLDGIYKSLDGGATWSLILNTHWILNDIQIKPDDPDVIFVSAKKLYRSPDGGQSWSILPGFNEEHKKFAMSKNHPNVMYVLQTKPSPSSNRNIYDKLFKSIDGGQSFTSITHGDSNFLGYSINADDETSRVPDFMSIAVHPDDPDEVHIGGVLTWRSLDGGNTFECTSALSPQEAASLNIGYCHRDVDKMNFIGSTLFVCSDGGFYKAPDTSVLNNSYYQESNNNMGLSVVSSMDIAQSGQEHLTIGTWDNGSYIYDNASGWTNWAGGNVRSLVRDSDDFDTNYAMTFNFGTMFIEYRMFRTEDGGNSITELGLPGQYYSSAFTQDPVDPNTIYLGSRALYKSTNKGASWTAISPQYSSTLAHVAVASGNNQIIYISDSGQRLLYKTVDGGANWSDGLVPYPLRTMGVSDIAIHPTKPNHIAIAGGGDYRVLVSSDGGASWINYTKNLPPATAYSLVWDDNGEDGLYVGTNRSVYYIDNTRENWVGYNNNLPKIRITNLQINNVNNKIYAATLGRGVWVSDKCDECILGINEYDVDERLKVYPNPSNGIVTVDVANPMVLDIRLFDSTGKLLQYKANEEIDDKIELDLSRYTSGIYYLRFGFSEGTITKRLIKE
ncbi:MAG: T9SS type A sorting domain-containing protein [Bacteroidota bacterium]